MARGTEPTLRRPQVTPRGVLPAVPAARVTATRTEAALKGLTAPANSRLPLPRILVILAHPDDEVLAVGARLERLRESALLCVTDGAPEDGADASAHGFRTRSAYSAGRHAELGAALALAQVPAACARTLLLPDGQLDGSARLRETVPDQGCALRLVELTRQIAEEIRSFRPAAVLTHPFEGGHPDHDSCAFAVHTALSLIGDFEIPPVIEAPFYHSRGVWHPGQTGIETGRFLPNLPGVEVLTPVVYDLSPEEINRKRDRLACFVTQRETLAQFGVEREQFRFAPAYDFTRPPHRGALFYESFPWGITGARFRELAAAALRELQVHGSDQPALRSAGVPTR